MATPKPKKSGDAGKKPAEKTEKVKDNKEVKAPKAEVKAEAKAEVKTEKPAEAKVVKASACESPMKGFFAKKCDKNENILTIFKTAKIWGALLGEMLGTMLFALLFISLGAVQTSPLQFWIPMVAIYAVTVGLSGAHLNPIVTAGAMATRRVSAIRGILYMLAQLLGAWIALIITNAFRLGSETMLEMPIMTAIEGETFWAVALVELLGALILGYCFARSLKFARKQPLAFAGVMSGAVVFVLLLGAVFSASFFGIGNGYVFNPVVALMYQILPTTADSFGELAGAAGLALSAYVLIPVVGGIVGFYLSDVTTRLSCGGYFCECDDECRYAKVAEKNEK